MNNKLPIYLTLLLLGNITWLKAQFNPESQAFLDKAIAVLHDNSGLQLSYEMGADGEHDDELYSSGSLWVQGELYRIESDDMVVVNDGVNQWIYRTDDKELMIQEVDTTQSDDSNPLSVIKSYKEGYKFDLKSENDSVVVVNMVSQDQFNPYLLVTVEINKIKNEFVSIQMLLRDESVIKVDLEYEAKDLGLKPSFFNFNTLNLAVSDTIDLR